MKKIITLSILIAVCLTSFSQCDDKGGGILVCDQGNFITSIHNNTFASNIFVGKVLKEFDFNNRLVRMVFEGDSNEAYSLQFILLGDSVTFYPVLEKVISHSDTNVDVNYSNYENYDLTQHINIPATTIFRDTVYVVDTIHQADTVYLGGSIDYYEAIGGKYRISHNGVVLSGYHTKEIKAYIRASKLKEQYPNDNIEIIRDNVKIK